MEDPSGPSIDAKSREALDLMNAAQVEQDRRTYDSAEKFQDLMDRAAMREITQTTAQADAIAGALGSDPTS